MTRRWSVFNVSCCGLVAAFAAEIRAGLTVTTISGAPTTNVVVKQTKQDGSGCTSIRYAIDKPMASSTRTGDSIPLPFRHTDRDLGQTFTAPKNMKLDAIVIRVSPDGSTGNPIAGRKIAVQFFNVSGTPVLHTNNTSEKSDDWYTGERYDHWRVAMNGVLPTGSDNGNTYLKFDLTGDDEVTLSQGKHYGYLLMLQERGTYSKLCLANTMYGGSSYPGGHAIRREGGCGKASEGYPDFCAWEQRLQKQPGTWGHPDVCTYRDHVFFLIEKPQSTSLAAPLRPALRVGSHNVADLHRDLFDIRGNRIPGRTSAARRTARLVLVSPATTGRDTH